MNLNNALGTVSELERAIDMMEFELVQKTRPHLHQTEQQASQHMELITSSKNRSMSCKISCIIAYVQLT